MRATWCRTMVIGMGAVLALATVASPATAAPRKAALVRARPSTAPSPTAQFRAWPATSRASTSTCRPRRCRPSSGAPVVVWVHGGGYRVGDKAQQVASKVALFASRGWIFASVNYRLSRSRAPARPATRTITTTWPRP